MKLHDIKPNPDFKLLDSTPEEPHTEEQIRAAMRELHARVHHQAANYGGKWNALKQAFDNAHHKFFPAQIARP
jgi:hypothetical protein